MPVKTQQPNPSFFSESPKLKNNKIGPKSTKKMHKNYYFKTNPHKTQKSLNPPNKTTTLKSQFSDTENH